MTEQPTNKTGKGRPTPTRKEREQANLRPIVGSRTPEARKAERARASQERRAIREAAMNGEEKYLTARDRGPQKRLARDYVDSRFSFGELLFPVLIISFFTSMFMSDPALMQVILLSLYAFLVLLVTSAVLVGRGAKKFIEGRLGPVDRGVFRYAAMRSTQSRFLRVPRPRVRRGDSI